MSFQMVLLLRNPALKGFRCFGTMSFQMVLLHDNAVMYIWQCFGTMSFQMVLLLRLKRALTR